MHGIEPSGVTAPLEAAPPVRGTRGSWPAVALALGLAAACAFYRVRTFDTLFHLAAGRYILETGALPAADPFSFSFRGAPWVNQAWGFQLLIAALHALGGFAALSFYQAAVAALLMAIALRSVADSRRWVWVGALLAGLPFVALREVLEARPHVLGFVCLAAILNQWRRFAASTRPWALLPIALLYALWTTVHGSHVLLFPVLGLLVVGCTLEKQWAKAAGLTACGAACAGIAWLLAAQGFRQGTLHLTSDFLEGSVSEWYVLTPRELVATWPGVAFSLCWAASCVGLVLAVRRRRLGQTEREPLNAEAPNVLLFCALLLLSLSSRRMLALFWFGVAPLWLPYATGAFAEAWRLLGRRALLAGAWPRAGGAVVLLGVCVAIFVQPEFESGAGLAPRRFPVAAVAAMRAAGRIHRVYNAYNFGGYLMYERFPDAGVFVDGRALTVYPELFLQRFLRGYSDPAVFETLAAEFRVDGVLLSHGSPVSVSLRRYLSTSQHWRLTHLDLVAEVYEPANR